MTACACMNWARIDGLLTNHHPNCPHYNDSLIDVWRVSYEGSSYVVDREPTPDQLGEGEIVTKEKMHREIFENLPEFMGF